MGFVVIVPPHLQGIRYRTAPGPRGFSSTIHANDKPTHPPRTQGSSHEIEEPGHAVHDGYAPSPPYRALKGRELQARRVRESQNHDPEETELGAPESRARASFKLRGSHRVHPGRRAQPPGTLDRAHPRR